MKNFLCGFLALVFLAGCESTGTGSGNLTREEQDARRANREAAGTSHSAEDPTR